MASSLLLLLGTFIPGVNAAGVAHGNWTLFSADLILLLLSVYLLAAGVWDAWRGGSKR